MARYTGIDEKKKKVVAPTSGNKPAVKLQDTPPKPVTVTDVRTASRSDKATTATTKVASTYQKNGYKYTESAPGSRKFQNFTAAAEPMGERNKPMVSAARKQSSDAKAASVTPKAFPKGLADRQPVVSSGKPGESMMAQAEAARPGAARQSTGPVSRKVTPAAPQVDSAAKARRGLAPATPVAPTFSTAPKNKVNPKAGSNPIKSSPFNMTANEKRRRIAANKKKPIRGFKANYLSQ